MNSINFYSDNNIETNPFYQYIGIGALAFGILVFILMLIYTHRQRKKNYLYVNTTRHMIWSGTVLLLCTMFFIATLYVKDYTKIERHAVYEGEISSINDDYIELKDDNNVAEESGDASKNHKFYNTDESKKNKDTHQQFKKGDVVKIHVTTSAANVEELNSEPKYAADDTYNIKKVEKEST